MPAWWQQIDGPTLNQGDLLRGISIPIIKSNFPEADENGNVPFDIATTDVLVLTQSCDLVNGKSANVLVAVVHSLIEFEKTNPAYEKDKSKWGMVSKGRVEGLHLLQSPEAMPDGRNYLLADFRHIVSLPYQYTSQFAETAGQRWRLTSPYLEAMSQAFGNLFMRVAIPNPIRL